MTGLDVERIRKPADGLHLGRSTALEASDGGAIDAAPLGELGLRHSPLNAPVQEPWNSGDGGAGHLPADSSGLRRRGVAVALLLRRVLGGTDGAIVARVVHWCSISDVYMGI